MRLFALLLLIFLTTCNNDDDVDDCALVLPAPPSFLLKFEDTAGNSLIGTTFVQDSFRLYNPNYEQYIKPQPFGAPDELLVIFSDINSDETYFLELDSQDTDTLQIGHSIEAGICFDIDRLELFIYNSEVLYNSEESTVGSGSFVIVKE